MSVRRLVYAVPFTFMALLCMAYAHSQPSKTLEAKEVLYETNHLLQGYCPMRMKTEGEEIVVRPTTETRTSFRGFLPKVAGMEELSTVTGSVDETLSVRFSINSRGEIHPDGYVYGHLPSLKDNRLLKPHECFGLQPAN